MADVSDYLELVRARASLTVIGDTLVGAAASNTPLTVRRAALPAASVLLYSAGMALNDYADAELDAHERPERPIPSGRISRRRALGTAIGLTIAGITVSALCGGRSALLTAMPLAAGIWTYDLAAKNSALGPVSMAACRFLDVMLGAAGTGRASLALPAAALIGLHTASVTALSTGEVHGSSKRVATASAIVTTAVTAAALSRAARARSPLATASSAAAAVRYSASLLPRQIDAVRSPDADRVRSATRSGIRAFIPLQAAMVRSAPLAAFLGALDVGAALLGRRRKADIT